MRGLCVAAPGLAGDLARKHLYDGNLAVGLSERAPLQAAGDQEALFGAGMLTFVQAVEHLAQALYRHGLAAPLALAPQIPRVASFSQALTSPLTSGPISFHTRLW